MWELRELLNERERGVCEEIVKEKGRAFCLSCGQQGCGEFLLVKSDESHEHANEVCEDYSIKTHHVKDLYDDLKEYAEPLPLCGTA